MIKNLENSRGLSHKIESDNILEFTENNLENNFDAVYIDCEIAKTRTSVSTSFIDFQLDNTSSPKQHSEEQSDSLNEDIKTKATKNKKQKMS